MGLPLWGLSTWVGGERRCPGQLQGLHFSIQMLRSSASGTRSSADAQVYSHFRSGSKINAEKLLMVSQLNYPSVKSNSLKHNIKLTMSGGSYFITPPFQLFKTFFSFQDIRFDKITMALVEEKKLFPNKSCTASQRQLFMIFIFIVHFDSITHFFYALEFKEQPQLLRNTERLQLSPHLEAFRELGPCCG